METPIIETVLTEILEEQKNSNHVVLELTGKVAALEEKVETFARKQENLPINVPPVDMSPIQKTLETHLLEVTNVIQAQPKSVIRQLRILLFPEIHSDHYYKITFGRILPWCLAFFIAAKLIGLLLLSVESSRIQDEHKYNYERYHKAWERLDSIANPDLKRLMDKVLE